MVFHSLPGFAFMKQVRIVARWSGEVLCWNGGIVLLIIHPWLNLYVRSRGSTPTRSPRTSQRTWFCVSLGYVALYKPFSFWRVCLPLCQTFPILCLITILLLLWIIWLCQLLCLWFAVNSSDRDNESNETHRFYLSALIHFSNRALLEHTLNSSYPV